MRYQRGTPVPFAKPKRPTTGTRSKANAGDARGGRAVSPLPRWERARVRVKMGQKGGVDHDTNHI